MTVRNLREYSLYFRYFKRISIRTLVTILTDYFTKKIYNNIKNYYYYYDKSIQSGMDWLNFFGPGKSIIPAF